MSGSQKCWACGNEAIPGTNECATCHETFRGVPQAVKEKASKLLQSILTDLKSDDPEAIKRALNTIREAMEAKNQLVNHSSPDQPFGDILDVPVETVADLIDEVDSNLDKAGEMNFYILPEGELDQFMFPGFQDVLGNDIAYANTPEAPLLDTHEYIERHSNLGSIAMMPNGTVFINEKNIDMKPTSMERFGLDLPGLGPQSMGFNVINIKNAFGRDIDFDQYFIRSAVNALTSSRDHLTGGGKISATQFAMWKSRKLNPTPGQMDFACEAVMMVPTSSIEDEKRTMEWFTAFCERSHPDGIMYLFEADVFSARMSKDNPLPDDIKNHSTTVRQSALILRARSLEVNVIIIATFERNPITGVAHRWCKHPFVHDMSGEEKSNVHVSDQFKVIGFPSHLFDPPEF